MTIFQNATGTKADRGVIGFELGTARQFLIFPKALKSFAGRNVVGIKYGLLGADSPKPRKSRAKAKRTPKTLSRDGKGAKKNRPEAPSREQKEKPSKVIIFPSSGETGEQTEEVAELKARVRRAMTVLEQGKPVAAFNLLKRIVGD